MKHRTLRNSYMHKRKPTNIQSTKLQNTRQRAIQLLRNNIFTGIDGVLNEFLKAGKEIFTLVIDFKAAFDSFYFKVKYSIKLPYQRNLLLTKALNRVVL